MMVDPHQGTEAHCSGGVTAGANELLGLQFGWANHNHGEGRDEIRLRGGNSHQPITFWKPSILTSVAASSSVGTGGN
jgi:hypothetical protein